MIENGVKTVVSASAETNATKEVKTAAAKAAAKAVPAVDGLTAGEAYTANLPEHHFTFAQKKEKKDQELAQSKADEEEENESESENESEDEDSGDESEEE
jgi:hypothetical protein